MAYRTIFKRTLIVKNGVSHYFWMDPNRKKWRIALFLKQALIAKNGISHYFWMDPNQEKMAYCIISDTPYPISYTPYPISDTPYPISYTPYPISDTPYPISDTPYPISDTLYTIYTLYDNSEYTVSEFGYGYSRGSKICRKYMSVV